MNFRKNIKFLMAVLFSMMIPVSISAMEENSTEEGTTQTGVHIEQIKKKVEMDEIENELGVIEKKNWDDKSNNLNNSADFSAEEIKKEFKSNAIDLKKDRKNNFIDNGNLYKNKSKYHMKKRVKNLLEEEDYYSRVERILSRLRYDREFLNSARAGADQETQNEIDEILGRINNTINFIKIKKKNVGAKEDLKRIKKHMKKLETKEKENDFDGNYIFENDKILSELKENKEYLKRLKEKVEYNETKDEIDKILKRIEDTEKLVKNKEEYLKIREDLKWIREKIEKLEIEEKEKIEFENLEDEIRILFKNKKNLKKILDKEDVKHISKNESKNMLEKSYDFMLKFFEEIMAKIKLEYYKDEDSFSLYHTIDTLMEYKEEILNLIEKETDEKAKSMLNNLFYRFYFVIVDLIKMFTQKMAEENFEYYGLNDILGSLEKLIDYKNFLDDFNKRKEKDLEKSIKQNEVKKTYETLDEIEKQMVRVFNIYVKSINRSDYIETIDKDRVEYYIERLKFLKDKLYVLLNDKEKIDCDSIIQKLEDREKELSN